MGPPPIGSSPVAPRQGARVPLWLCLLLVVVAAAGGCGVRWSFTSHDEADLDRNDAYLAPPFEETPSSALPPPGVMQPVDPAAARESIRRAVDDAYSSGDRAVAEAAIDDATGLAEVRASLPSVPVGGRFGPTGVQASIDAVVFVSAAEATYRYTLRTDISGGVVIDGRIGTAVLKGDRWVVTRETVCADLSVANLVCPPRPR